MSDRKLANAVQSLLRQIWRLHRSITKSLVNWMLRTALIVNRKSRRATAGFVLPTTVLLILVVALTAGAFSYRAFNTSTRSIAETKNRVIYNAATPAIDRARSKIEFLFDSSKDTRYPGGVPSEEIMVSMMLNGTPAVSIKGQSVSALSLTGGASNGALGNSSDPYTLPGETRVDANGDGNLDNAWSFRTDTDGNGTEDATVVYSVILSTPPNQGATQGTTRLIGLTDVEKATGKVGGTGAPIEGTASGGRVMSYVRSGPLANASTGGCATGNSAGAKVEGGWYQIGTSAELRKNFQVDALVVPDSVSTAGGANFATLEFQQDRKLERGNKWGAWFRNDLEIFPGPQFNWNGAMHTEGNLMIGGTSFSAYLISSPSSCLNYESASEISVTSIKEEKDPASGNIDTPAFNGIIASSKINDNAYGGSSLIYLFPYGPTNKPTLTPTNDWSTGGATPFQISSNSTDIQIKDGRKSRAGDTTNISYFAKNNTFNGRFKAESAPAPYVDDTYRADNRYGPKLVYDNQAAIPAGKRSGDLILPNDNVSKKSGEQVNADPKLIETDPTAGSDSSGVGLDGYWERRARNQGLRVLVGQRLELGNTNGWVTPQDRPAIKQIQNVVAVPGNGDVLDYRDKNHAAVTNVSTADPDESDNEGDPLYPPHGNATVTLSHEARQRRALRDNIAAVQSAAVYHAAVSRDYPIACLASTAHPGTPFTVRQSINFVPTAFINSTPAGLPDTAGGLSSVTDTVLMTDFFNGRGTNGWEFEPPGSSSTNPNLTAAQAQFEADINNRAPIWIALKNLAQFAGDYNTQTTPPTSGAFPPTQDPPGGRVHPYPELTMWGNYSNLRRTLAQIEAGTQYDDLSPADKTYLQTAACTLGMLAYNIDRVQRFDPRNPANDRSRPNTPIAMQDLAIDIRQLMDGIVDETPGVNNYEVLPKQQLATYGYGASATPTDTSFNARDYDRVPAEAFLGKLREYYLAQPSSATFNTYKLRLAELIFSYFQIRRDRTYGFRPSPAANTWNFNPYVTTGAFGDRVHLWSSACDPNVFALNDAQASLTGLSAANISGSNARADLPIYRVALSRLCGTVIPSGGVHDAPGDYGLPQRYTGINQQVTATLNPTSVPPNFNAAPNRYLDYIPSVTSTGQTTFPNRAPATPSPATFKAGLLWTTPYDKGVYLQATVAPKWPSLFYLFPECDHDQIGLNATCNGRATSIGVVDLQNDGIGSANTDGDWSDDIDLRQPNGQLPNRDPSGPVQPMLAAFQPWAEPYITDTYINTVNPSPTTIYRVVDSASPAMFVAASYPSYITPTAIPVNDGTTALSYKHRAFNSALDDRPVFNVALRPRKLPSGFTNPFPLQSNPDWELPVVATSTTGTVPGENNQYRPPNRILVPSSDPLRGAVAAIPFLDRVMFNGREWMPIRTMDIDIGMLRRNRPRAAIQGGSNASRESYPPDSNSKNDVWLPVSGIVYAIREDSVREDSINRPPTTVQANGTPPDPLPVTDVRNPSLPIDPPLQWAYQTNQDPKISVKAVDGIPDPDRRPHGFRLRNGSQLARHSTMNIPAQDNIRGLSFFTDNPLYIMGDYNLHQNGTDDQATGITRLEEFTDLLPDTGNYSEAQFYGRTNRDTRFADAAQDRWRPSEILADAISVVSDTLCDGSAIDTFMTTGTGSGATISATTYSGRTQVDSDNAVAIPAGFRPYNTSYSSTGAGGVSVYDNRTAGMFGPGCTGNANETTFLNQNRPSTSTLLTTTGYAWMRENPFDIFSPVKVSRNGSGLLFPALPNPPYTTRATNPPSSNAPLNYDPAPEPSKPRPVVPYTANPVNGGFYTIANGRPRQDATDSRVNTIIISGLVPSRQNQSYGGLHNFPRFLEFWDRLWFAGSFLQLNFSNYATAPFDQKVWEPDLAPISTAELIGYYDPPDRLWGYDVALQLAPAGPAAARFVTPSKDRNEFYNEPAVNDPYIRNLCVSLPNNIIPDNRCPS